MDDNKIIDLYWERSELAISETANKSERYCYSISYNILHSEEDAEECVNDTYLSAWKSMPRIVRPAWQPFWGRSHAISR